MNQYLKLGEYIGDTFIITPIFNQLRQAPHFKPYLADVLNYGLIVMKKSLAIQITVFRTLSCMSPIR